MYLILIVNKYTYIKKFNVRDYVLVNSVTLPMPMYTHFTYVMYTSLLIILG
jgi:hypothetical protein